MSPNEQEQRRKKIEDANRRAAEHNRNLLPETPGYVRTEGPRRQYRAEVDQRTGSINWIEQ